MGSITRREMLAIGTAGAGWIGLPLAESVSAAGAKAPQRKLKVMVVGAHPDDPEQSCGGTITRYADAGHEVVVCYLTRGEAGIHDKTHEEAAAIRTAEAEKACEILGARPLFAGQIDGSTEVSSQRYDQFRAIVEQEKPDILFTHWPIDTHRDHRVASLMTYDAWLRTGRRIELFYFQVVMGFQTQLFWPTHYVDITATESRKKAACQAHASQYRDPERFYSRQDEENRFRGRQCRCQFAEAFIRHVQNRNQAMPGL